MANGGMKDQMKMVRELQKAQKDLKKEIVEVEAGDGAVVIQVTGELKIKKIKILKSLSTGFRLQLEMAQKPLKILQPKK